MIVRRKINVRKVQDDVDIVKNAKLLVIGGNRLANNKGGFGCSSKLRMIKNER